MSGILRPGIRSVIGKCAQHIARRPPARIGKRLEAASKMAETEPESRWSEPQLHPDSTTTIATELRIPPKVKGQEFFNKCKAFLEAPASGNKEDGTDQKDKSFTKPIFGWISIIFYQLGENPLSIALSMTLIILCIERKLRNKADHRKPERIIREYIQEHFPNSKVSMLLLKSVDEYFPIGEDEEPQKTFHTTAEEVNRGVSGKTQRESFHASPVSDDEDEEDEEEEEEHHNPITSPNRIQVEIETTQDGDSTKKTLFKGSFTKDVRSIVSMILDGNRVFDDKNELEVSLGVPGWNQIKIKIQLDEAKGFSQSQTKASCVPTSPESDEEDQEDTEPGFREEPVFPGRGGQSTQDAAAKHNPKRSPDAPESDDGGTEGATDLNKIKVWEMAEERDKKAVHPPKTQLVNPPKTQLADPPKTQLVNSPKTQLADPPKTQLVNSPKTKLVDPPKTQLVNPPKTQLVDPPKTQLLDPPKTQLVDPPKTQLVDPPKTQLVNSPKTQLVEKNESKSETPTNYQRTTVPSAGEGEVKVKDPLNSEVFSPGGSARFARHKEPPILLRFVRNFQTTTPESDVEEDG